MKSLNSQLDGLESKNFTEERSPDTPSGIVGLGRREFGFAVLTVIGAGVAVIGAGALKAIVKELDIPRILSLSDDASINKDQLSKILKREMTDDRAVLEALCACGIPIEHISKLASEQGESFSHAFTTREYREKSQHFRSLFEKSVLIVKKQMTDKNNPPRAETITYMTRAGRGNLEKFGIDPDEVGMTNDFQNSLLELQMKKAVEIWKHQKDTDETVLFSGSSKYISYIDSLALILLSQNPSEEIQPHTDSLITKYIEKSGLFIDEVDMETLNNSLLERTLYIRNTFGKQYKNNDKF